MASSSDDEQANVPHVLREKIGDDIRHCDKRTGFIYVADKPLLGEAPPRRQFTVDRFVRLLRAGGSPYAATKYSGLSSKKRCRSGSSSGVSSIVRRVGIGDGGSCTRDTSIFPSPRTRCLSAFLLLGRRLIELPGRRRAQMW